MSYFRNNMCSGFRVSMFPVLHNLLHLNNDLFQYAFQHENYLWTHAGVHRGWWEYSFKGKNDGNVADQLNNRFKGQRSDEFDTKIETLFHCGWDRGGSAKVGGPLWVDRNSLWEKGIYGYNQIVGHSKVPNIMKCDITKKKQLSGSITFCDCLDSKEEFHIIEI